MLTASAVTLNLLRQLWSLFTSSMHSSPKHKILLPRVQAQAEQLSEVTTRLNKTLTKLELAQGQLDKAHREIKDLKEAAQVQAASQLTTRLWHPEPVTYSTGC